jgi:hypothetical protein
MAYGKIQDIVDIWYSESGLRIGIQLQSLHRMRLDHASKTSPSNLYRLLCMSRHAIATDPRDKIYGLLGISKANSDRPMMPDYTKSVQKVFTEATVISVLEHSAIPYLDFPFDHINNHLSMSSTPSWVLDFTIHSIPLVHEHSNSCNALYPEKHPFPIDYYGGLKLGRRNLEPVLAGQILRSVRFSKDFRTLRTHGVQIATIAFCHPDTSDYEFDSEDLSSHERSALSSLTHFYCYVLKPRMAWQNMTKPDWHEVDTYLMRPKLACSVTVGKTISSLFEVRGKLTRVRSTSSQQDSLNLSQQRGSSVARFILTIVASARATFLQRSSVQRSPLFCD